MNLMSFKKTITVILLLSVMMGQSFLMLEYVAKPTPVQAFWGVGDFNFSTQIANLYDIAKEVGKGILVRIATKYADKYLTKFIQKLQDKYKIRNFLYYDQVLTDYYLSNFINDKIADPDLRQIFAIMYSIDVSGNSMGFNGGFCTPTGPTSKSACQAAGGTWTDTADPNKALIPKLKQKINQIYLDRGGIPQQTIYNPPPSMTNVRYYQSASLYWYSPPNYVERNLSGQFGAFQSSATTAAQLEVIVGNGLKAGRIIGGTCSLSNEFGDFPDQINTPETCKAQGGTWQPSALDQIRSFIDNPSSFIEGHLHSALDSIFKSKFDTNNPYYAIGSLLGDFIFNQLNLSSVSGGGLEEDPNAKYDPGTGEPARYVEIDTDGDGWPEGRDENRDGKLDTCYHGGTPPDACKKSGTVTTSVYFTPLCDSLEVAINSMVPYSAFIKKYSFQIPDNQNFANDRDAFTWQRHTSDVDRAMSDLVTSVSGYHLVIMENLEFTSGRYAAFISDIDSSLGSDQDLDLHTGPGLGGGGLDSLISNTDSTLAYLQAYKDAIGKCEHPDFNAGAGIPPPTLIPPDYDCTTNTTGRGNDPGAPSSIDINTVDFQHIGGSVDIAPWPESGVLNEVRADNEVISFNYSLPESWQPYSSTWVIVWRRDGWKAWPFSYRYLNESARDVGDVFCGGAAGGRTLGDFDPTEGDTYGFMMSTAARSDGDISKPENSHERSNIVMYTWPSGISRGGTPPPPPPTGPNPPPDADSKHGNHTAEVAEAKNELIAEGKQFPEPNAPDECFRFEIVKRAVPKIGGGAGYLDKPGGNNCGGRAVDIIAFPDGYIYDVLAGSGDGSMPAWNAVGCGPTGGNGTCPDRYRANF
ncbi:MAG TPA: hypothetical protein VGQ87_02560 [Patescibacteria group bacterium]|nr:hypothetical protein [Patescibacteria group bacterium]